MFKPGFLTNNYNQGKRASYVHPFRLYIFITIVYFFASPSGVSKKKNENDNKKTVKQAEISNQTQKDIDSLKDQTISYSTGEDFELSIGEDAFVSYDTSIAQYREDQAKLPEDQRDGLIASFMKERSINAQSKGVNLADTVNQNFKKNSSKMIFVLLPMFALILMLIFRKEKLYYVEHFFHSVYLHSFLFLSLTFFSIISYPMPESIQSVIGYVAIITMLYYVYKSCRVVYKEHAIIVSLKLILTAAMYVVVFLLAIAGNAFVSFLML